MPSSGITISNTFAAQSGNIPASELDVNFAQGITALNALGQYSNYFVDSGAANAMAITVPSPLAVTLSAGLYLQVKVAATNTAAVTLTINGGSSTSVVYPGGAALLAGQLISGAIAALVFDGTYFQYVNTVPVSGGSSGTLIIGPPPTVTTALGVNAAANAYSISARSPNVAGQSYGPIISAGTNSSDTAFYIENAAATTVLLQVTGDGGVQIGEPTGGDKGLGTLNTVGLYVNGVSVSAGGSAAGTFTGTLTGMTATTSGTINYCVTGNICTLYSVAGLEGTSNSTSMTMTGLPSLVQPANPQFVITSFVGLANGSFDSTLMGSASITGGTITFAAATVVSVASQVTVVSNFQNSSGKGLTAGWSITYALG